MIDKEIILCGLLPVCFPEGLYSGDGSHGNQLGMVTSGDGTPVLRGSSIAGVVRHSLIQYSEEALENFFGTPLDGTECNESKLVFYDANFSAACCETSHNRISRHRGAVMQNCIFSIERILPGAKSTIFVELFLAREELAQGRQMFEDILSLFRRGICMGGSSNRGMGRVQLDEKAVRTGEFDLGSWTDMIAYQHFRYDFQHFGSGQYLPVHSFDVLKDDGNTARWEIEFAIPRGQDLLIGGANSIYPQSYNDRWVIPGSTLRGALKGWIAHLMAYDGIELEDSAEKYDRNNEKKAEEVEKVDTVQGPSPLLKLFGSLSNKGLIHISDAISTRQQADTDCQLRKHVTIDRFSGGAITGGLFSNYVLTSRPDLRFRCTVTLQNPDNETVDYLCDALRALHQGLLKIGSSKAAGRLEIASIRKCFGNFELDFNEIARSF